MNHRWLTCILLSLLFSNVVALLHSEERDPTSESTLPELTVRGVSPEEVSVHYFDIEGRTVEELKNAIKKGGPSDNLGVPRDAFAGWHLTWRWPLQENGTPDFMRTVVACTGKVTLPRWRPPTDASPAVIAEWRRYFDALVRHERKHLEHCFSNREKVRLAVIAAFKVEPNLTAEEANGIVTRHLKEIRALDVAYDATTENGKKEGVRLGP